MLTSRYGILMRTVTDMGYKSSSRAMSEFDCTDRLRSPMATSIPDDVDGSISPAATDWCDDRISMIVMEIRF